MTDQKGNASLIMLAIVLLVVVAAAFYFMNQRNSLPGEAANLPNSQHVSNAVPKKQASSTSALVPEVKNPQDLVKVSGDLDNTNLDNIDTQLNQNDADSSTF